MYGCQSEEGSPGDRLLRPRAPVEEDRPGLDRGDREHPVAVPAVLGQSLAHGPLGGGPDRMQDVPLAAQGAAQDDETLLDQRVHEPRVLGEPLLLTQATREVPRSAALEPDGEEHLPGGSQTDLLELLGHLGPDQLESGRRPDEHLELGDLPGSVEGELVDALDLPAVDGGGELEHGHPVGRILELVDVVELTARSQDALGGPQDLHHLVAALIGLEQHRAAKHGVRIEQLLGLVDPSLFDRGAEASGEHRTEAYPARPAMARREQNRHNTGTIPDSVLALGTRQWAQN